jgi:hypothetical protein
VSESLRPSLLRRIGNSWRDRSKKSGTIDLLPDGFVFAQLRQTSTVRWDDLTQIDAGVRDGLALDLFFVIVHANGTKVRLDEIDDGFRLVEVAVLERWPQLRERWVALQCGPAHQPQYETLWRRGA